MFRCRTCFVDKSPHRISELESSKHGTIETRFRGGLCHTCMAAPVAQFCYCKVTPSRPQTPVCEVLRTAENLPQRPSVDANPVDLWVLQHGPAPGDTKSSDTRERAPPMPAHQGQHLQLKAMAHLTLISLQVPIHFASSMKITWVSGVMFSPHCMRHSYCTHVAQC
jgi:hypothetical protein